MGNGVDHGGLCAAGILHVATFHTLSSHCAGSPHGKVPLDGTTMQFSRLYLCRRASLSRLTTTGRFIGRMKNYRATERSVKRLPMQQTCLSHEYL